jgi:hypothetical protein
MGVAVAYPLNGVSGKSYIVWGICALLLAIALIQENNAMAL